MSITGQETRLPSAPERGEAEQVRAGSPSFVNAAPSMGHREEAAGRESAPEMGNRKSSALDSGSERGGITAQDTRLVTVCSRCLRASCWQGQFYCDDAKSAGTVEKTVAELEKVGREHASYWFVNPATGNLDGQAFADYEERAA